MTLNDTVAATLAHTANTMKSGEPVGVVNGGAKGNHKAVGEEASPEAYPAIQEWIEEGGKDVQER